jgi:Glyoxalase-like domain
VSITGGRHPGWGTANRIEPLGDTYLELVAAVDTAEAAGSGRWVAAAPSGRPLGWAVRTRELEVIADRLGLTVTTGSRRREDGVVLRWRMAGIEQAVDDPALPFFIEWGDGTPLPGRAHAGHRDGPVRIDQVELSCDAGRLDRWLGTHDLAITMQVGASAVTGVVLRGAGGSVAIPGAG